MIEELFVIEKLRVVIILVISFVALGLFIWWSGRDEQKK